VDKVGKEDVADNSLAPTTLTALREGYQVPPHGLAGANGHANQPIHSPCR
jgi:hypothetical protein